MGCRSRRGRWLAFVVPIAVLPLAPWLVLSPLMARSIESRTRQALDTSLSNMSMASGGGAVAAVGWGPGSWPVVVRSVGLPPAVARLPVDLTVPLEQLAFRVPMNGPPPS